MRVAAEDWQATHDEGALGGLGSKPRVAERSSPFGCKALDASWPHRPRCLSWTRTVAWTVMTKIRSRVGIDIAVQQTPKYAPGPRGLPSWDE